MMKKRLISVLLVLATIAAILAGSVSAATNAAAQIYAAEFVPAKPTGLW